jgi:DNA-binding transcriptional LysR family regulator
MEFRHLRYFLVLAEELHFGRAAKRLSISQPPLSVNIRQLEASLGVLLFERSTKGVKLTPAGFSFRDSAVRLLTDAHEAEESVRNVARGVEGRIRVGFVGAMLFRGMPEWLGDYQKRHPKTEVVLRELNSVEQVDALVRGELDLGFVHTERIPPELSKTLYLSEPFVCCLPATHPAARRQAVQLHTLSEEPFVMFSKGASPDYYERVLALCAEQGFKPRIRHEVRHWLSAVSLVSKSTGIAVVPHALSRARIAGVKFLPLHASGVRSEVFCLWNPRRMPSSLPTLLDTVAHSNGLREPP